MKSPRIIALILATASITAGFTAPSFGADEKDASISLAKVPKAVQKTIALYAAESEVKKAEKGDQDGKAVYEFDIEQGARKFELTIAPNGDFLGSEEEIPLSAMPAAAQTTITASAKGGKIIATEKAVDAKKNVLNQAVIEKDGKKIEIAVDADGKIVTTEDVTDEKD